MRGAELARREIARFLASKDAEVLCIRGEWGIGKTFIWKTELDKATASQALGLPRYAYVSLFGLNSLDALKLSIFENSEFQIAEAKESLDVAKKRGSRFMGLIQKSTPVAAELPVVGKIIKAAEPLFFSTVRNTIICIDDMERRGAGLSVKDILGLCSFLKEQRNCKMVILLNDKELDDKGLADLSAYHEKVVDSDLRFAPEAEDSARIALPGADRVSALLGDHCKALGISNIRVIKKLERAIREVEPLLNGYDDAIFRQATQSVALLGWSKLQPSSAPSLEYLRTKKGTEFFGVKLDGDVPPEEAAWNALLDKYGFGRMDEFDLELLKSLQNGVFDPDEIRKQAQVIQERLAIERDNGSFEDAWRGYHDSFDSDAEPVLDHMYDVFRRTVHTISPVNLNGTVSLFRELGRHAQADELISFYVAHRRDGREFWDLEHYAFSGDVTDAGVIKAFGEKLASYPVDFDAKSVLMNIAEHSSWDDDDLEMLASLSPDEYYRIFKDHRGKDLSRLVSAALKFSGIMNMSTAMQKVTENARQALRRIGEESPMNARRVRRYGISIDGQQ